MGFNNEYVSEEDIQKYQFLRIWRSSFQNPSWPPNDIFKYCLSVDKEAHAFLLHIAILTEGGRSGLSERTNKWLFMLSDRRVELLVTLEKAQKIFEIGEERK